MPEAQSVQIRGFIAEKIVVSTTLDPFLSLKALAAYSSLSVRRLRQLLDLPPSEALPCYRLGKKLLVRRSDFDAWIAAYESRGRPSLAEALRRLGLANLPK